jgi:long-chain acyl-CoA synthetase
MQITQGLRRAIQVNADGIATIFGNRRHTYRQFVERVARLAGALANSASHVAIAWRRWR